MKNTIEVLEEFEQDMNWLNKNYDKLKNEHPEEHVAIFKGKVVDHDSNLNLLMERLEEKYPQESGRIVIEYVTTKKIELIL